MTRIIISVNSVSSKNSLIVLRSGWIHLHLLFRHRAVGRPQCQRGQQAPTPWSSPPCKPPPHPQSWSPGHCCSSASTAPGPERLRVLLEPSLMASSTVTLLRITSDLIGPTTRVTKSVSVSVTKGLTKPTSRWLWRALKGWQASITSFTSFDDKLDWVVTRQAGQEQHADRKFNWPSPHWTSLKVSSLQGLQQSKPLQKETSRLNHRRGWFCARPGLTRPTLGLD